MCSGRRIYLRETSAVVLDHWHVLSDFPLFLRSRKFGFDQMTEFILNCIWWWGLNVTAEYLIFILKRQLLTLSVLHLQIVHLWFIDLNVSLQIKGYLHNRGERYICNKDYATKIMQQRSPTGINWPAICKGLLKHKHEDFLHLMQLPQPLSSSYSTATQIPPDENPSEAATLPWLRSVWQSMRTVWQKPH